LSLATSTDLPLVVTPANWRSVLIEEARLLLRRHWWEFLLVSVLIAAELSWPRFTYPLDFRGTASLELSRPWPGPLYGAPLFVLLGTYMAFALWRAQPPGNRSYLLSVPINPIYPILTRVLLGAGLLALALLLGWYTAIAVLLYGPVQLEVGLPAGFLPPWQWLSWVISIVNTFLAGSMIALAFRHPWRVVLYSVAAVSVLWLIFTLVRLGPLSPLRVVLVVTVLPPYGVLGGMGIWIWGPYGAEIVAPFWIPLVWLPILAAGVVWTASRATLRESRATAG